MSRVRPLLSVFVAVPCCVSGVLCDEGLLCRNDRILVCSDWNDLQPDGWEVSSTGLVGIEPGVGVDGTPGWHMQVPAGGHGAKFFDMELDPSVTGYGPLHARFYVRFSPGFNFRQPCGLNKMFYLESWEGAEYWRVMLGIREARSLGGGFRDLPETVGVFGFDYIGHLPEGGAVPSEPGDRPILIYPGVWYSVEIMAHWKSRSENTVKIWVDGVLQMTRRDFDDGVWTEEHRFDNVQDSSHIGGLGEVCSAPHTQSIYKDNHVLATGYIGPRKTQPPFPDTTPPTAPAKLSASADAPYEIGLAWEAARDNVGVSSYNIHRSGRPGLAPGPVNRIARTVSTSYVDTGISGTHHYVVTAEDPSGNVSPASEEATATAWTPSERFIRGDSNRDGLLDVSDVVFVLLYLFAKSPGLPCPDAGDADDNGILDLADAIFLMNLLYRGSEDPPAPFPDEGSDPTEDSLPCEEP